MSFRPENIHQAAVRSRHLDLFGLDGATAAGSVPRQKSGRAGPSDDIQRILCSLNARIGKAVRNRRGRIPHKTASISVTQYDRRSGVGLHSAVAKGTRLPARAYKAARISGSIRAAAEGIGYGILRPVRDAAHIHGRGRILRGIGVPIVPGAGHHLRPVQGAIAKGHAGPACPNKAAGVSVIRRARRFF